MQPCATDGVSPGSAEEPYVPGMTHSYRLTEGRLIRYPSDYQRIKGVPMRLVERDLENLIRIIRDDYTMGRRRRIYGCPSCGEYDYCIVNDLGMNACTNCQHEWD